MVAVYTFRPKRPATTAGPSSPPVAAKAQGEKAEEKEPGSGAGGSAEAATATGEARNPFAGPGSGETVAAPTGQGAAGEKGPGAKPTAAPAGAEPAPTVTSPAPGVTVTAAPAAPPLPGAGQAAVPALRLAGVVAGQPTIAVIREGDRRYYARVGDRVGDRYRVQAISPREVVLVGKEGKVILRMGGRQ